MGDDAKGGVDFVLRIPKKEIKHLAFLRKFDKLKVARDDSFFWIKDASEEVKDSIDVKSIPNTLVFIEKNMLLYEVNKLLPFCPMPNFLWTSIKNLIPLELPPLNFNYFENLETIPNHLCQYNETQPEVAILTTINELIDTAKTISYTRFSTLKWVLFKNKALIFGTPLLPVKGETFWQFKNYLIPSGLCFKYMLAAEDYSDNVLNPESLYLSENNCLYEIKLQKFKEVSGSSIYLTKSFLENNG